MAQRQEAAGQQGAAARWPSSLEEGYRRALRDRKPLLICVGAKWSAPSRKMAKEMDEAAVAARLSEAIAEYEELLRTRPDDAAVRQNLAQARAAQAAASPNH